MPSQLLWRWKLLKKKKTFSHWVVINKAGGQIWSIWTFTTFYNSLTFGANCKKGVVNDPRGQPKVMAGRDNCFRTCCPFVRASPLFKSRKTKQQKTIIATGVTMGLAEWIIDDTCFLDGCSDSNIVITTALTGLPSGSIIQNIYEMRSYVAKSFRYNSVWVCVCLTRYNWVQLGVIVIRS